MKWRPGKTSGNIEDRRSQGGGLSGGLGGGGLPIPMGRMGGGGAIGVIIAIVLYFLVIKGGGGGGFDVPGPSSAFPQVPQTGSGQDSVPQSPSEDNEVKFVSFVLDDAQTFWKRQFAAAGKQYRPAKLVLFRGQTNSGCGAASSATGPFYCPLDQKVYIDLGFFDELNRRFKAPGDFAQAYVLTHEIGHHVQQQLGIEGQVAQAEPAEPGRGQRALGAPRAPGRLPRRRLGAAPPTTAASSRAVTSRRASGPPRRSATTGSSLRRRVGSTPRHSPTAPQSSGSTGCRRASTRESWSPATRSPGQI